VISTDNNPSSNKEHADYDHDLMLDTAATIADHPDELALSNAVENAYLLADQCRKIAKEREIPFDPLLKAAAKLAILLDDDDFEYVAKQAARLNGLCPQKARERRWALRRHGLLREVARVRTPHSSEKRAFMFLTNQKHFSRAQAYFYLFLNGGRQQRGGVAGNDGIQELLLPAEHPRFLWAHEILEHLRHGTISWTRMIKLREEFLAFWEKEKRRINRRNAKAERKKTLPHRV
jgi:hypothetical protein